MGIGRLCRIFYEGIVVLSAPAGQYRSSCAVRPLVVCEQPCLVTSYDRRSSAVSEQNASASVIPIHNFRQRFRPQNQSCFINAGFYVGIRNMQREHKARTCRVDIKRHRFIGAKRRLHFTCG